MSWPLSQDYNEAVQHPAENFADPELRLGEATTNALGIPMPYSGNFADVYEVRCPGGGRWAVKCFTRQAAHLRERYLEISRRLRRASLPFTVDFSYLEEGIYVAGQWRPALKMQWVEGLTLNQFVGQALDRPAALEGLLQIWVRMAKHLRTANIAHCDLQHGNVLLVPAASGNTLRLKLIDYDGMWVPALARMKSGEVGHPSYQHPQRQREGTYSAAVDRFPLLLIAAALRALMAGGRALWERYDNGDNLLFREADLREPKQSALFRDLFALGDPATAALTASVVASLKGGLESAPPLDEVLAGARRAHQSVARRVGHGLPPTLAPAAPITPPVVARSQDLATTGGWGAAPAAIALAPAAPVAPDPWDFDAPAPESDSSDYPPDGRPKARRTRSPIRAIVLAASAMGAVAALLTVLSFWAVGAFHRPEPARPAGPLARNDSHATPRSDPSGGGNAKLPPGKDLGPGAVGVAHPTPPSAVPPAYPGKVKGFTYPRRHDGPVRVLCTARDGGVGFSLGADKILYKFMVKEGSEMDKIPLRDGEDPRALAVTPDGRRLLIAGGDRRLHLRDLQGGTEKLLAGQLAATDCVDVAADGRRALSCGEDGAIRLWDLEKGAEVRHWPGPAKEPLSVMRFSPGGWRAISSGPDHVVRCWDVVAETQTFQIRGIDAPAEYRRKPVTAVLLPDGRQAAVGMTDGTIDLWDLEVENVWKTLPAAGGPASAVRAVAVSPDGRLIAAASEGAAGDPHPGFTIWDLENPAAYPCETPPVAPECLAFTSDGRHVLAGCIDGTVHCWEITGLVEKASTAGSGSTAVVKRLDPPTDAQVAVAMKEVQKTFQADYAQLDGAEDYHDLAVKRLAQARQAADQPLRRYALYLEARDLATRGDDPALGLRIVEEMGKAYAFDVHAAKVKVLETAGASVRDPAAVRPFLDAAVPFLKAARADDAYASVAPLFGMVEHVCMIAGPSDAARAASALVKDMTGLQKDFEDLQTRLQTLKAAPDDPDASQAVGEFYCLRKQDWDKGLRSLALGRDKALAAAAAKDRADPSAPDKQAAVGDAWWDLAGSKADSPLIPEFREAFLRRAYVWYDRALPLLGDKEEKRVADRAAELCRQYPDLPVAWEQLDVSKAAPVGDFFVRMKPGQVISTKEAVAGPVEITVVARGGRGGAFFQCRRGKDIVVIWDTKMGEKMVYARRPIPSQPSFTNDFAPLPPGQGDWNTYTCTVAQDQTAFLVNGKPVPTKKDYKNDVSDPRTFQLEPKGQQVLEVKSFTVKPLQQ